MSYDKFTDRARKVMRLANAESQRLNHEYIGTEHILLGLLWEGTGRGVKVLRELKVNLPGIRKEIEELLKTGPDRIESLRRPKTATAEKVLQYAAEEAMDLCHNYVGTEHLLLGLLKEKEGLASQVLQEHKLSVEDVREEVITLIAHEGPGSRGISAGSKKAASDESAVFLRDLLSVIGCPKELVPELIMQLCEPHHYDRIQAIAKEALAEIKR